MTGVKGRRPWGNVKKQPTKVVSYQASFIGPDGKRHYAPNTFTSKMNAERWLIKERDILEHCGNDLSEWKAPKERKAEKKAEALTFGVYGKRVIDQRKLAERTRTEYEAKWSQLIEPTFGRTAVKDMNSAAVRAWFAGLDPKLETRNGHAYSLLNTICNTAVKDGLLDRNPCVITGATTVRPKKEPNPPTVAELHTIADTLGENPNYARFKALVLLAGWCGLRIGEVTELRRKDISAKCDVVSISRAVGHRSGRCILGPVKNKENRKVDIPPHIQQDIKDHMSQYVSSEPDALLFVPARGGCHLNDRVFNKDIFQKAAKDVDRADLSAHDLRRFAGTTNAAVGATLAENMKRLGHRTSKAAMLYQAATESSGKRIAADLSAHALAQLNPQATNDTNTDETQSDSANEQG